MKANEPVSNGILKNDSTTCCLEAFFDIMGGFSYCVCLKKEML